MILNEFLVEMSKIKGWNYDFWGLLRVEINGVTFCPITAVCFQITGKVFMCDKFLAAADEIGLDYALALRILEAADCPYSINDYMEEDLTELRQNMDLAAEGVVLCELRS